MKRKWIKWLILTPIPIKYIVITIVAMFIIIEIYISFYPDHTLYLNPNYRSIIRLMKHAENLYKIGRRQESFQYYKKSLVKSGNVFWNKKFDIFYIMSQNYRNEKYYYDFLEEIFQNQYIEGKGRNYKYSIDNYRRLVNSMMDINSTRTLELLRNTPEKCLEEDKELKDTWYYYTKMGNK